jgi:drug/metabolite transporter (DMT)-like permease
MADVIRNTSLLGAEDRAAIAAYIASRCRRCKGRRPPPKKKPLAKSLTLVILRRPRAARASKGDGSGAIMNTGKGILLKLISAALFAVMSALIRYLGAVIRSAKWCSTARPSPSCRSCSSMPGAASSRPPCAPSGRSARPAAARSASSACSAISARWRGCRLIESNAISFTSPLFSVALAALMLKERVRIYRWSAVIIGFLGVLVVLAPHFSGELSHRLPWRARPASPASSTASRVPITNAGTVIQTRRLTQSETTSSIVFYFSLSCALAGLATWPFGWLTPTGLEFAALISIGLLGGMAHIVLTESYRHAAASVVAPFDYTAMIWALVLGYVMFGESRR